MAHIAVHAPAKFSVLRIATSAITALGNMVVAMSNANGRVRQIEFLQSLSDADLAARGLKREEIAMHVFKDLYYI